MSEASHDPRRPQSAAGATASVSTEGTPAPAVGVPPSVAAAAELAAATQSSLDASIAATLAMDDAAHLSAEAENGSSITGAVQVKQEDQNDSEMRDESADPNLTAGATSATGTPALQDDESRLSSVQPEGTPALGDATTETSRPAPKSKGTSSLSRVAQLTARVEKNPMDGEAQLALLQDAEQKGDLERTREVYESFLTVFPDAVSVAI